MRQRIAAEPPRVETLERIELRAVGAGVQVHDEAPGGAGLIVVVTRRERDVEAVERDVVNTPVLDHPGEDAKALAVRGATARHAVDPSTGADRLTVARLEIAPADTPAHARTTTVRTIDASSTIT